jgi:outer membrane murein-binding lipoprotein Lpp
MKKILLAVFCTWILSGCSVLKKKDRYGCPTNGKNVGAEKILSGDKAAMKAAKKAGKFKS